MTDDESVWAPADPAAFSSARPRSWWRWTWRLAIACALLDTLALISASTTKNFKCDDGYTNEGDNLTALALLVIPLAAATVGAGLYVAVRDQQHRRPALILTAAVVVAAAAVLIIGETWMSGGPYQRCLD